MSSTKREFAETSEPVTHPATPEVLVERLSAAALGTLDLMSVYLGDRLGYYHSLASDGPATSVELARRTSTAERYAREWLEQQAVTGILLVDDPRADAGDRRYTLPVGYEAVLTDPDSLTVMTPTARFLIGALKPLPQLLEAFHTGAGVPYEDYGADVQEGQAAGNRPQFRHLLAQEWLPAMPDVHARLLAEPPARVADVGMGFGWSSIAIARGFPRVRVDGFDLDEASVDAARANAEAAGLADRVTFQLRDAGDPELAGRYDLAVAIECVHDMANPVAALAAMRRLVGADGSVLVVDGRVADRFTAPGDETERSMYGYSILHCLPVGMVDQPSAETGAVMRASTMRGYAAEAGFAEVEVLPISHDTFRFYRLTP